VTLRKSIQYDLTAADDEFEMRFGLGQHAQILEGVTGDTDEISERARGNSADLT
jgi:hypothetical protein